MIVVLKHCEECPYADFEPVENEHGSYMDVSACTYEEGREPYDTKPCPYGFIGEVDNNA